MLTGKERNDYLQTLRLPLPTTALAVMQRAMALIKEDTRRFDMNNWGYFVPDMCSGWADPATAPPCGTVACASGWCGVVLTGQVRGFGVGQEMDRLIDPTGRLNIFDGLFNNTELLRADVITQLRKIEEFITVNAEHLAKTVITAEGVAHVCCRPTNGGIVTC